MLSVSLIVAMTRARLIGRDNAMPWHWPEDLRHFKRATSGQTVIMGRRSFESLGLPLKNRTNLVVSRSIAADAGPDGVEWDGVRHFGSLEAACAWVERNRPDGQAHAWILGGGQIYRQVLAPLDDAAPAAGLPRPERLLVTWVPDVPVEEGDVVFPFDEDWIEAHYEAVERWRGEDGQLEFVDYRLRA